MVNLLVETYDYSYRFEVYYVKDGLIKEFRDDVINKFKNTFSNLDDLIESDSKADQQEIVKELKDFFNKNYITIENIIIMENAVLTEMLNVDEFLADVDEQEKTYLVKYVWHSGETFGVTSNETTTITLKPSELDKWKKEFTDDPYDLDGSYHTITSIEEIKE